MWGVALVCCLAVQAIGQGKPEAAETISPAEGARLGASLVADLLRQVPVSNTTNTGTLRIQTESGVTHSVPVRLEIAASGSDWFSRYEIQAKDGQEGIRLTVTHRPSQPNHYLVETVTTGNSNSTPRQLTGDEAMVPFAGSDFWLADLGLEFLHWPRQTVLKKEMRRGQFCHKLESVHPSPKDKGYSRVVAWIDTDSGGIVLADAYDAKGERLKQFAPKEFKKVHGQWQLQEMEIRNLQTGSSTRIEFDLSPKPVKKS